MIVKCARCHRAFSSEGVYLCDQCGEMVCIDCLRVPGSDNNESECVDCPAIARPVDADGLTRADRIADGHLTPEDAEWLTCEAEERKDGDR